MKYELTNKGTGTTVTLFINGFSRSVTLTKSTPQAILKQLAGTNLVKEIEKK
jgi:hypothetical protein